MKLFGRRASSLLNPFRSSGYLTGAARAFAVFERPLEVLWCYARKQRPARGYVDTRRGLRIHLSGDPADVVTVFVIFARLDYGRLAPGIVAVDVGANIGVFALFAAASGARRVLAFEPSAESYRPPPAEHRGEPARGRHPAAARRRHR